MKYLREIIYLLGPDKHRVLKYLLLFFIAAFVDLVGVGLIGPYVLLITNPEENIKYLEILNLNGIYLFKEQQLLLVISILLILVYLLKLIVGLVTNYLILRFTFDQQTRLRSLLMMSYQAMPYSEYIANNSSRYIHSMQVLVAHYTEGIIFTSLKAVADGLIAIFLVSYILVVDPLAFIFLFSLMSILLIAYYIIFQSRIYRYGATANQSATDIVQGLTEGMDGFKDVRVYGCENYFYGQVEKGAKEYSLSQSRAMMISTIPRFLFEFAVVLFVVLYALYVTLIKDSPDSIISTLAIFGLASIRIMPAINSISGVMMGFKNNRDSISRLYSDVQYSSMQSIEDEIQSTSKTNEFLSLRIKNLTFRYENSLNDALKDLNLDINSGESIGLIGTSGSGKTTLVDTLLGLLEPQEGEISYNDKPLRESLSIWRSHVAYIPQQVFLIDNTLRKNVALGIDDKAIDDDRVKSAIQMALLSDLVDQLPDGVETILGERGARLSGGQRQRVALARAFYHERDVLVLDEATSALDNDTEKEIVAEIKRLKGKKTMIVIAHRLTTVQHCDRIYKLENGKIVASGTPREMLVST